MRCTPCTPCTAGASSTFALRSNAAYPTRPAIRFADTGPGIGPAILAQLTLGPVASRRGSGGMGLLFCRRVLESMGGSVEVCSAPGQGASITLYFKSGA
ncbi:sensor histidine kinase [Polaromonas naphthalenivorans]|uniref:sensor histidine kinase n=1 Tax=Polaromonas naphthalenivorans TaxID=216465 RepID=UPI000067EA50|nr:ATP-binding protein [Polaromonas naphthalenivorans]